MRIAHISDLHFCTEPLKKQLQLFSDALTRRLPIDLDIAFHDSNVTLALRQLIQELDPSVIIISGDITTFGDRESFDLAYQWIDSLITRSYGHGPRTCVVLPGNHDVLQGQLSSLLRGKFSQLPFLARTGIKRWLNDSYDLVEKLTRDVPIKNPADIFNNFQDFARKPGLTAESVQVNLGDTQKIFLHPFRSVSINPIWMNLGQSYREEIVKINGRLPRRDTSRVGELHILALHHNPISSANVAESPQVNAYNSMPSGVQLLKTLQQSGIDLVLHGHQHEQALASFDFDLKDAGHAFAVGIESSTSTTNAGCNLLTIEDINHIQLNTFKHRVDRHRFDPVENWTLCLERHRPIQPKTSTVRFEIKHYIIDPKDGNEGELWDEVLLPGSELIYISGRRLQFVTSEYLAELNDLLRVTTSINGYRGTYVRLLISNPRLLRMLAEPLNDSTRDGLSRDHIPIAGNGKEESWLWGRTEDLLGLAADAERAINLLKDFVSEISEEQRSRIDVRLSHTLLPFAATVRDANKAWGKMVVRMLPVGAMGELSAPVIKLHRRKERALYDYYFTHLQYLMAHGTSILGHWDRGDDDLRMDNLPAPNPSRTPRFPVNFEG